MGETVSVSPLAGSGKAGFADGQGRNAQFYRPSGIAIDAAGNLYVADETNNRIRKVTPQGKVSTLAGREHTDMHGLFCFSDDCLFPNFADGKGSNALFSGPVGVAIDKAGNLYVTDGGNHSIRKVTPQGEVSTLAGSERGSADGEGSSAQFDTPYGITIDVAGNLYVADKWNHRIRKITPKGEVSTLAGRERGFADGQGSEAQFNEPHGIAIDAAGNLYVMDTMNTSIRKITPQGEVSTFAGSQLHGFADGEGSFARFEFPRGITIDAAGNLYVADAQNNRIRKVTQKGTVSTIAGSGERGFADGEGSSAQFEYPSSIAIDAAGNLYVTDWGSQSIRKIEFRRP
jgi:DNA-binding beta-propeller fold protein YncE